MGGSSTSAVLSKPCPTDYHHFRSLSNQMEGAIYNNDEDLKNWLYNFYAVRPRDFEGADC